MMNYEKITQLFEQQDFQQAASGCQTMEDWHQLLTARGIGITLEETVDLVSRIAQEKQKMDGDELSAEDLDEVSGGVVLEGAAAVVACVGVGALCVGAFALAAYVAYKELDWKNKSKSKSKKTSKKKKK